MSGNEIDEMLKFDPLLEAEKVSGFSYKEDQATSALGMLLAMEHGKIKGNTLKEAGDTYFNMPADYFLRILERERFVKLYQRPIKSKWSDGVGDKHYIFANAEDGMLVSFDTYSSHSTINGGNLYFNWESRPEHSGFPDHCSGHFNLQCYDATPRRRVFCGHIDIREGLIHNLTKMRAEGSFLRKWVETPFLWLLSYEDTQNDTYDYEALNAERISRFAYNIDDMVGAPRG